MTESGETKREINAPLGYLRGFLVLLVVAHHSALAYAGMTKPKNFGTMLWRAFPIVDAQHAQGLQIFSGFNDIFFMSLLFLLSGVFVSHSIERKGALGFLGGRILRLGIPFVIGAALLAPLAYLPAYLQSTGGNIAGFWSAWRALPVWPSGPVWFIWLLLAFDVVATLFFVVVPGWARAFGSLGANADDKPFRFFLLLVLLSALAYAPMAILFGSASWLEWGPFAFQTSRIVHYALYFLIGIGLGALGTESGLFDPAGKLAKSWWLWIVLAIIGFIVIVGVVIAATISKGQPTVIWGVVGGLGFSFSCAATSFACLAVFLKFFDRHARVLDSLRDNSFGIYLFHYALVSWLQYELLPVQLPAIAKFGIVFAGAALSAWTITALLRKIPAVRRIL